MAPFEMVHERTHPLKSLNPSHYGHFSPTIQRYPAYAAGVVPFRWMLVEQLSTLGETLELDVDEAREPDLGYKSHWVHEVHNQTELLEGFAAHLRCDDSLCFFYAKDVPFVERTDRILLGVGRIKHKGALTEYARSSEGPRGMLWERPIQHSIRPDETDGFLMPYFEVLHHVAEDPSANPERYAAFAPAEHWETFSYGSELVTHDGAIGALLSMESALSRIEEEVGIRTDRQREWVQSELIRLWRVRGPFPGLGAVLCAFGLSRGLFVAHALQREAGDNEDPWPRVDAAFQDPTILPPELRKDLKELAPIWRSLPPQRRQLLRLLSRFELNAPQTRLLYDAESRSGQGWPIPDEEILANPYGLFEITRHDPDGIQLVSIDRGIFPDDIVRTKHPLEAPSSLDSAVDARRVRAFAVSELERAAAEGHTLQFAGDLARAIRESAVRPECQATTDILRASVQEMLPEVEALDSDSGLALQLARYKEIGEVVRKNVRGRVTGTRHVVEQDWYALLEAKFGPTTDARERRAREEKAQALKELAESRFSVLAGPAGTGKTTILGLLCSSKELHQDGLLLLAPTGKARVRMQQLAAVAGNEAMTIAQFLNRNGRYDGNSGRYHMSDRPKATGYGTVIIDEASMLTEDMIGSLLDSIQGVKRLILVGDPAQLPPIGAGRPFVDIAFDLRPEDYEVSFPRVAPGYAELTVERRQIGSDCPDLRLARWFSTSSPSPGDDDILSETADQHERLRFVEWKSPEDFEEQLLDLLTEELGLDSPSDVRGFNHSLGAFASGEYEYFNPTRNGKPGAVAKVEAWQILSPLRGMPFGVGSINGQIHKRFRAGFMGLATRQRRHLIPKPLGVERVVYGDKLINLRNHRRDGRRVYPREGAIGYLANGEIGVAVGQWKTKNMKRAPSILKVEFSSQEGYTYDFFASDFSEEGSAALELAYALTVHKAQGSQFGLVILVLPEEHPILSRELVYTALTRHQQRIVVMHQGPRSRLKELSAPHRSETARRRTNLLAGCQMLEFPQPQGSVFLQEGLIHRTSKGLAVRSKSELLIAEALGAAGVDFVYENPLTLGGRTRYPDFTIEDDISGRTVYWEHLGMLSRPEYQRAWERKIEWYRDSGVSRFEEAPEAHAVLVTTSDSSEEGLDMREVHRVIAEVCGG